MLHIWFFENIRVFSFVPTINVSEKKNKYNILVYESFNKLILNIFL